MTDFIDIIKDKLESHMDLVKAYGIVIGCLILSLFISSFVSNSYQQKKEETAVAYQVSTVEDMKEAKEEAEEIDNSASSAQVVKAANEYLKDYYGYDSALYQSRLTNLLNTIHFEDSESYNNLRLSLIDYMPADLLDSVFAPDVVSTNTQGHEVSHIDAQHYSMSVLDTTAVTYKADNGSIRFVSIVKFKNQDSAVFPSTICGEITDDSISIDSFSIESTIN